ncbi:MAG: FliM/FliN family flagellar motor switch protein [Candidatus Eremiobacteraeota bacterium]|nr:FliM/FliN family flagellar motor switch protein [Candidatus Eremiobacteraeota bacterium]MBV8262806.1 FliM/FliN family flagellar motor switch protein [Candidatus Eremiobacteraeota bacterium]MBV8339338.1 FliM/FliN family flagellar motor switch protein [Candidatus Eremiobacteraeota bacterium]MBV8460037.1 FliM/FliN family flagellar motor switch protein [Candidatus Eremiobacteraeota bacterium]MBV8594649.1 FliM/FliN family flagellar motor switch protein [Candidatus Eremiobacteraeota bacterium]
MNALGLESLSDVQVTVTVLLGRATASIAELLSYAPGTIIPLDVRADAPVELFVNGVAIASGDLVSTEDGGLAVQIVELVRPIEGTK